MTARAEACGVSPLPSDDDEGGTPRSRRTRPASPAQRAQASPWPLLAVAKSGAAPPTLALLSYATEGDNAADAVSLAAAAAGVLGVEPPPSECPAAAAAASCSRRFLLREEGHDPGLRTLEGPCGVGRGVRREGGARGDVIDPPSHTEGVAFPFFFFRRGLVSHNFSSTPVSLRLFRFPSFHQSQTMAAPGGGAPFDFSALSSVLNDPSIREMAESIANNPAFASMTQSLQASLLGGGGAAAGGEGDASANADAAAAPAAAAAGAACRSWRSRHAPHRPVKVRRGHVIGDGQP